MPVVGALALIPEEPEVNTVARIRYAAGVNGGWIEWIAPCVHGMIETHEGVGAERIWMGCAGTWRFNLLNADRTEVISTEEFTVVE